MKNWQPVKDESVRHVWNPDARCAKDCECETAVVSPTFYQDNGTPSCECGSDFVYSHTEVAHEGALDDFAVISINN